MLALSVTLPLGGALPRKSRGLVVGSVHSHPNASKVKAGRIHMPLKPQPLTLQGTVQQILTNNY
eukprot:1241070-Amphidinium_carterae.1